jgi:NAD(P)-dependent dehydrogenase (short-subunit alcohol dehydrogenase family)
MNESRIAVITGAASGIGRATAYRMLQEGYSLHLLDVEGEGLATTVAECEARGGAATGWVVDLLDREALEETTLAILALGTPQLLVNNAGIGVAERIDETSWETWDRMMAINVNAPYRLCHLIIPRMVEAGGGIVVNIASVAALVGVANRAAYCTTKGALLAMTRAVACDFAAKGVRINAICPGTVASEWIDKIIASDPDPEQRRKQMSARQLDNQMGSPAEVAEGVAFLTGPGGRFVNGSGMVMDGGMSAC